MSGKTEGTGMEERYIDCTAEDLLRDDMIAKNTFGKRRFKVGSIRVVGAKGRLSIEVAEEGTEAVSYLSLSSEHPIKRHLRNSER